MALPPGPYGFNRSPVRRRTDVAIIRIVRTKQNQNVAVRIVPGTRQKPRIPIFHWRHTHYKKYQPQQCQGDSRNCVYATKHSSSVSSISGFADQRGWTNCRSICSKCGDNSDSEKLRSHCPIQVGLLEHEATAPPIKKKSIAEVIEIRKFR